MIDYNVSTGANLSQSDGLSVELRKEKETLGTAGTEPRERQCLLQEPTLMTEVLRAALLFPL